MGCARSACFSVSGLVGFEERSMFRSCFLLHSFYGDLLSGGSHFLRPALCAEKSEWTCMILYTFNSRGSKHLGCVVPFQLSLDQVFPGRPSCPRAMARGVASLPPAGEIGPRRPWRGGAGSGRAMGAALLRRPAARSCAGCCLCARDVRGLPLGALAGPGRCCCCCRGRCLPLHGQRRRS